MIDPLYLSVATKRYDRDYRALVEKHTEGRVTYLRMDRYPNTENSMGFFIVVECAPNPAIASRFGNAKQTIAVMYMTPVPGCCGAILSHNATTASEFQRKGIGTLMNSFRLAVARDLGYSVVLVTDTPEKHPWNRRILDKLGFKHLHSFTNKRTSNKVTISVVDI